MHADLPTYTTPTSVTLSHTSGAITPCLQLTQRHVSDLAQMFHDPAAVTAAIALGDPLVYEIRAHPFLTDLTDMVVGTSVIFSGKIGSEYYMTKGHFHERPDQAEIYQCVRGQGFLQMMTAAGDYVAHRWEPGVTTHIPPQYAHRVVNTGAEPLVFVSVYHLAAGHTYAEIESRGFKYLIVERDGQPVEELAPQWA